MCLTLVVLVISQPNEYEGVTAVKTEVKQALGMGVPVVPRFMSIAKMPEPAAPATVTQEQGALVEDAKDCNHHDLSHPTPLSLTQPWPKSTLYQAVSRSRGTLWEFHCQSLRIQLSTAWQPTQIIIIYVYV